MAACRAIAPITLGDLVSSRSGGRARTASSRRPGLPRRRPPGQPGTGRRRRALGAGLPRPRCRTARTSCIRSRPGNRRPQAADGAAQAALHRRARAAWAQRWEAVDVRTPDDPAAQLAIRYALFQLWCNTGRHDELAVGARGLSGTGYAGHVFWDADVFVLPALVSIDPPAARAMVRYRPRLRRGEGAGTRRWPGWCPLPLGVRGDWRGRHAAFRPRGRRHGADPHRAAGGARDRRRRMGGGALRRVDRALDASGAARVLASG